MNLSTWFLEALEHGALPQPTFWLDGSRKVSSDGFYQSLKTQVETAAAWQGDPEENPEPRFRSGGLQKDLRLLYKISVEGTPKRPPTLAENLYRGGLEQAAETTRALTFAEAKARLYQQYASKVSDPHEKQRLETLATALQ